MAMNKNSCAPETTKKTKGERTRDTILGCASELFWKNSFHAVNTSRICAAAGVNKATLYRYFPSKEALALGVNQYNFEMTRHYVFEKSFAEHDDPAKRLTGIYRRVHATHRDIHEAGEPCPGCPFVNLGMELGTQSTALRQAIRSTQEAFAGYYKRIIRAANTRRPASDSVPEARMAAALVNLMNGALVSAKLADDPGEILKALPAAKLLAGLQAEHHKGESQ